MHSAKSDPSEIESFVKVINFFIFYQKKIFKIMFFN